MPSCPWDTRSSSPQWIAFWELKSPGKLFHRRCELRARRAQSSRCPAVSLEAFHAQLALPPALTFLSGHWWGRTGKKANLYLSFCPRAVKIVCCGTTSSFLTTEGLCFNFYLRIFNYCPFSLSLDSSAHAIVFSNSRCQNLGLGWGQWTLNPTLVQKKLLLKKKKIKQEKKNQDGKPWCCVSCCVLKKRKNTIFVIKKRKLEMCWCF